MKATSLIFGVILMSLVMASFGLMITDTGANYGVEWDNTSISLYNQLNDTEKTAYDLQDKLNTSTDTSALDVVGLYITKAVDSLKLTYKSMGSAITMTETATNDLGFPRFYTTAIITMIIVFIVLGVIISAMIKKDV